MIQINTIKGFEEVAEILSKIKDINATNFCINLKGHGCTIFAKDVYTLKR